MLRDVALGGADILHDVLDADFLISQGAENFQPERVRHGL